jgi:hypothetical protein
LKGKEEYIFIDIFNAIAFDLNENPGQELVSILNGQKNPSYLDPIKTGDVVEVYWK